MALIQPLTLYPFQAEGVALCLDRKNNLVAWDTGLGKSICAITTASMLFDQGEIDHVLLVAKGNKLGEWQEDIEKWTDLSVGLFHGPKRAKILDDLPQVVLTTYDTARIDSVRSETVSGRKTPLLVPNRLTEALRGRKTLVVYDEFVKLANRKSALFKSQEVLIKTLTPRVMALTATPLTRSPENFYNLGRLLVGEMCTVAEFEKSYIASYDFYGNPRKFKNLERDAYLDPGVTPLSEMMGSVMIRKRKTDDDVRDQFPRQTEEYAFIELDKVQREFYDTIEDIFKDEPTIGTVLRQIAGHPSALLHSQSEISQQIVGRVGKEGIRAIPSAKTEALVEYLIPLTLGQGAQVVVFTFFGPSMIPYLKEALEDEGITCSVYYGDVSDREEQKDAFRRGETMVLLSSDAGSDGINLPEASYAVEYDIATTHALRVQRLNRISRINSTHELIHFQTFIAKDTVENRGIDLNLMRHEWSDKLYEIGERGEAFVSAKDRKAQIASAR